MFLDHIPLKNMFLLLLSLQGFYGTVALIASLSLSLTDSCVIWWISFLQDKTLSWPVHTLQTNIAS